MDEKTGIQVFEEVGRLCVSWSYLEGAMEATLCGILGLNDKLSELVTWKMDIQSRGQMIVDHAPSKHTAAEVGYLKDFNTKLKKVAKDRNIILHGRVHKSANRPSCWTVYRGEGKGKNYPVSPEAVIIARVNIHNLGLELSGFNDRHGYREFNKPSDVIETDWPKPL
jgi:hypothetical protein